MAVEELRVRGTVLLRKLQAYEYIILCSCLCQVFLFQALVYGQETLGEGIDCTDVRIDYSDDPTLTQEERLRLMDKAFIDSLNKFEFCQALKNKEKAAGGGESGEGAGGAPGESVASSTMSGTETGKSNTPAGKSNGSDSSESSQSSEAIDETGATKSGKMAGGSGKLPEDIPPAENDDILAAQIRYAAEQETDPVKKKQLWDEYRKYKGLAPSKK